MTTNAQVEKQFGKEIFDLARDLFGRQLGEYFIVRFLFFKYLGTSLGKFERYLRTGNLPNHDDDRVQRFERQRKKYERELRAKLRNKKFTTHYWLLVKKLKERENR